MITNKSNVIVRMIAVLILASPMAALAEDNGGAEAVAAGTKEKIGIATVKVNPSVLEAAKKAGTANSLNRIVEGMDSQLIDRVHNTRKFQVVARSDLNSILKEQDLAASGNVDQSDTAAAKAFSLAGCKYLLVVTVDDFQDVTETLKLEALGEVNSRRTARYSAVAKIYNTTSGQVLETANFQLSSRDVAAPQSTSGNFTNNGDLAEHLFTDMARMMSDRVANRVVDVIYPAKILAKSGNVVTFNRGDGTGVMADQIYEVYSAGKVMKDPDTGEILGQEEIAVGHVRVSSVTPKFSKADILDDHGILEGQILRPVIAKPSPPQP